MKHILFALLPAAIAVTACSDNDEPTPAGPDAGNEISFYAIAPRASRAPSTTTANLQDFVVYAFTDASMIMNGVTVTRDGGAWSYSPPVYWPALPVDFYAITPDIRQKNNAPIVGGDVIKGVECGSTDLLYAVSLDRIESPTPVPLTFRHAMSKVSVMLSSTSDKYAIEVYHVSLNNISLSGDFTIPQQDTADDTTEGTWDGLSDPKSTLLYYDFEGGFTLLSPTPHNLTEGNLETSFFVPQSLSPLKYAAATGFTGNYMQIDCIVKDKITGQTIWPNEHTPDYLLVRETDCGRMLFPLATPTVTAWQQGYSYVYNIIINTTYSIDTIEFDPAVKDYLVSNPI